MTTILDIVKRSPHVRRAQPWQDRVYLDLVGYDRSMHGDRSLKVWINKAGVLTIKGDKGYRSAALGASLRGLCDELEAAGAVRSGYGDTIEATYTLGGNG